MIGAMVGGAVADRVGRKRGLLLSQFMGAIGGEVGMILTFQFC